LYIASIDRKIKEQLSVIKTVILALDSAEVLDSIVQALNNLKITDRTKLIFVRVLPSPEEESNLDADIPHQLQENIYQEIEARLEQSKFDRDRTIELVKGDPSEEIVRLANIYRADLIVLGNRGLKGLKRVIAGSVSSQVVADAPCSVLVVKL
jgi:nucleotide-binding universal stress UspA family protein